MIQLYTSLRWLLAPASSCSPCDHISCWTSWSPPRVAALPGFGIATPCTASSAWSSWIAPLTDSILSFSSGVRFFRRRYLQWWCARGSLHKRRITKEVALRMGVVGVWEVNSMSSWWFLQRSIALAISLRRWCSFFRRFGQTWRDNVVVRWCWLWRASSIR